MTDRTLREDEVICCNSCASPAVIEVEDCREIPSTDPDGWREFEVYRTRRGCQHHPVKSMTTYLDGRVIPSADCIPEKVPCQLEAK